MPNTGHHHAPQTAISALNHDVLLNIFHWYRLVTTTDGFDRGWNLERWWYRLIHVCRTWQHLILASRTRMDLHLVCTYGTPITTMLAHSPPLPLIIYFPGRLGDASGKDEEDVVFALQHHERVRRIHLRASAASLPKLVNAMACEYPTLQRLVLRSHTTKPIAHSTTGILLPTKLQAPLLQRLTLSDIRLPASSELLLRASGLVTLELLDIADTPEIHPAHLVAQLARMAQLERLILHFRTALPNRTVERTLAGVRVLRTTLPRLALLSFRGSSAYLNGTLARLVTPALQTLFVDLFAQLTFDLPSLVPFVRSGFQFHAAELHFDAENGCVLLDSQAGRITRTNPVQLRVSCRALEWQLAALAQICGVLTPLFARVEGLTLGLHVARPSPDANLSTDPDLDSDLERAEWHELLRAFGGTKTLQLAGPRAEHLLRTLLPLPAELLPGLQELLPGGDGEPAEDGEGSLAAFTIEREAAGCPVRVVRDWW
ncbi:hypothetical protein EI94DRAFT_1738155 [Lactarius quietus]|nr:hypothetical protein EI94DRAFT_1738155 [Lactarius quietus]